MSSVDFILSNAALSFEASSVMGWLLMFMLPTRELSELSKVSLEFSPSSSIKDPPAAADDVSQGLRSGGGTLYPSASTTGAGAVLTGAAAGTDAEFFRAGVSGAINPPPPPGGMESIESSPVESNAACLEDVMGAAVFEFCLTVPLLVMDEKEFSPAGSSGRPP